MGDIPNRNTYRVHSPRGVVLATETMPRTARRALARICAVKRLKPANRLDLVWALEAARAHWERGRMSTIGEKTGIVFVEAWNMGHEPGIARASEMWVITRGPRED